MSQLGFFDLLDEAEAVNTQRQFERETVHLPGTMAEALPFYRDMIERHHAAMLAADIDAAMAIREEAHRLAEKLNGGEPGILAGPDAPGCVLERETAAQDGAVPLWGQTGSFILKLDAMRVRVEMDGMFGIGSTWALFPNFAAHAVDWDKPFLSETGYRSFMGLSGQLAPGLQPDAFVCEALEAHIRKELKGRPLTIRPLRRRAL